MNTNDINKMLEIRESRRFAADARYEKKMELTEAKIGQLMREGKIVYYVCQMTKRGLKVTEGDWETVFEKALKIV